MTEAEWQTEQNPDALLSAVRSLKQLTSRKGRLFACGCFRLVWDRVRYPAVMQSVEVCESRADTAVGDVELESARYPDVRTRSAGYTANGLMMAVQSLAIPKVNPSYIAWEVRRVVENIDAERLSRGDPYPTQADLVRCIFGNPFRPVAFDPRWRSESAVALARTAYDTRNFTLLPILADALEEAGCDHADVLTHCREPNGVHVRGCWVVDGVLSKS